MSLDRLNYHHLHYFWAVAKDGNLSRTARSLRVSQSALSAQIKQLEAQLGEALFAREGRGLVLTEAGRIAKRAGVGELLLTHIPPWTCREEVIAEAKAEFDGPVHAVVPGETIDIAR